MDSALPHSGSRSPAAANRRLFLAVGLLAASVPFAAANASTVASFVWVDTAGTGSGSLSLTLPGTITTNTFSVATTSLAQAFNDITAFQYTFSDGLTINLSNLTAAYATAGNIEFTNSSGNPITNPAWATSNASHGGFGSGTPDLITGFIFSDVNSVPHQTVGTGGLSNWKISEPLSLITNVGQGSNQITPTIGTASNDAGYWKLSSLTPVPLPGAAYLLISGMGGLVFLARRRKEAATA
jgi:hypothetical protein